MDKIYKEIDAALDGITDINEALKKMIEIKCDHLIHDIKIEKVNIENHTLEMLKKLHNLDIVVYKYTILYVTGDIQIFMNIVKI